MLAASSLSKLQVHDACVFAFVVTAVCRYHDLPTNELNSCCTSLPIKAHIIGNDSRWPRSLFATERYGQQVVSAGRGCDRYPSVDRALVQNLGSD